MKKVLYFFLFFIFIGLQNGLACDVCEKNQPAAFQGFSHGTGPTGTLDMIIIWASAIIVAISLFLSIKYLVKPKEGGPEHIKNIVSHDF